MLRITLSYWNAKGFRGLSIRYSDMDIPNHHIQSQAYLHIRNTYFCS